MVIEWVLLAVAGLLIAANALFVAAEFSFVTVDRASVDRDAERGDTRSQVLQRGLRTLSTQLSSAQLGITITSLLVGFLAEPSLASLLRPVLSGTGLGDTAVSAVAVGLALFVATVVQMVLGELIPKNWAIAQPLRAGRTVARAHLFFTTATLPVTRVLNGAANRLVRLMGIEPTEELASARNPRELSSLARRSGDAGTIDAATAQLVARSIEFGDQTAADVMTPRTRLHLLPADATAADLVQTVIRTGHARFPVVARDADDILGLVHVRHALAVAPDDRSSRPVRDLMVAAPSVPETVELDPLLARLRNSDLQMAVVVDEYGGTAGIVTLEDLLEEIVGEIEDEQDAPERRHTVAGDGSARLSGLLRPDEAGSALGLDLPEAASSETLGGLLVERLGRLAVVGDVVVVDATDRRDLDGDGLPTPVAVEFRVARMDGRRIDRVVARRVPPGLADAATVADPADIANPAKEPA